MALLLTSVDNCHVLRSCRSSQVYTLFYIAGISICNVLSSFAARGEVPPAGHLKPPIFLYNGD